MFSAISFSCSSVKRSDEELAENPVLLFAHPLFADAKVGSCIAHNPRFVRWLCGGEAFAARMALPLMK